MTPNMPHGVYTAHQRSDETVRETEARALLSCASKLDFARREESTMDDYINAIKHNQQLWTIFQVCLCEQDNPLPRDLKILLLNISRYIDKVSFRALSEYDPNLLRSLIEIDRTIAAGLAKNPESSITPPSQIPPSHSTPKSSPTDTFA